MSVDLDLELKPTPIQAMEQGLPMTDARQMLPDALTYDDCRCLLEAEYPKYVIADRYSLSMAEFHEKLREFGLKRNGKSWDFRAQKTEPESRLTPGDLTREQAARMLLAGVGKTVIRRKYNYPNDPACYLQLEKWGLHRKNMPTEFQAKQEEIKRMAAAVLEEIERGEKSAIKWHEDKVKSDVENPEGEKLVPESVKPLDDLAHGLALMAKTPSNKVLQPPTKEEIKAFFAKEDPGCLFGPDHHCNEQECLEDACPDLIRAIGLDRLGKWYREAGLIDEEGNYHPECPISDAVTQAIEAGEVKVETVEKRVMSEEKLIYLRDLENALSESNNQEPDPLPHANPVPKPLIRGKRRDGYLHAPLVLYALIEELPPIGEEWDGFYKELWTNMFLAALDYYYQASSLVEQGEAVSQ